MSRMLRLVLIGLASSAVACGSSSNESSTRSQAFSGETCSPDKNEGCNDQNPIAPPPGPKCAAASLSLNMCLDYGTLERIAALACESQGTSVSSISFDPPCDSTEPLPGSPAPPGPLPPDTEQKPDSAQTDPSQQPGSDDGKPPTGGLEPKPQGRAMGVKFACCAKPPQPPNPCIDVPIDRTTNGTASGEQVDPQLICAERNMVASGGGGDSTTERPSYVRCCPGPISPPVERCMTIPVSTDNEQACTSKAAAEQQAAAMCAARNFTYRSFTSSSCGTNGQDESTDAQVRLSSVLCCDALAQPQSEDPSQKSGDQPGN